MGRRRTYEFFFFEFSAERFWGGICKISRPQQRSLVDAGRERSNRLSDLPRSFRNLYSTSIPPASYYLRGSPAAHLKIPEWVAKRTVGRFFAIRVSPLPAFASKWVGGQTSQATPGRPRFTSVTATFERVSGFSELSQSPCPRTPQQASRFFGLPRRRPRRPAPAPRIAQRPITFRFV